MTRENKKGFCFFCYWYLCGEVVFANTGWRSNYFLQNKVFLKSRARVPTGRNDAICISAKRTKGSRIPT